jgi:hypothetical protein
MRGMPPIDDIGDIGENDENEQLLGLPPAAPVDAGQRVN